MSVHTIIVRPILASDAESFRDCLDEVARERRFLATLEAPPLARVTTFVTENVENNRPQLVAVEEAGTVVGWADIIPNTQQAMRHVGTLGMGVRAAHRGQGLGRRLLTACIDHARSRGIERIELTVRVDNDRAIALYESLGFRVECRRQDHLRVDGVSFDSVQMSLLKSHGTTELLFI